MSQCERFSTPVARKEYRCDAAAAINEASYPQDHYDANEWALIEQARRDGNKILPGMKYHKVRGKWDGEFETFRGRPELCDICSKYELWEE